MKRLLAAVALTAIATPAFAQLDMLSQMTVTDLVALANFEVKGIMPSSAGPGILLQGVDGEGNVVLVMCFVAETPGSETIKTQYCKRVE